MEGSERQCGKYRVDSQQPNEPWPIRLAGMDEKGKERDEMDDQLNVSCQ